MGLLVGPGSIIIQPQSVLFSGTLGTAVIDYDRLTIDRTSTAGNLGASSADATLEIWIKPTAANNNTETGNGWVQGNIFVDADSVEGDSSPVGGQFGLSIADNVVNLGVSAVNSETYTQHVGTTIVNDLTWHWIVFVWDSSTGNLQLYVDGNRDVNTSRTSGNMGWVSGGNTKAQLVEFGGEKNDFESGDSLSFFGKISEIRFSDNVRYNGTSITVPTTPLTADGNTIGLWSFTEGSGTTIGDSSSNNENMTVVTGGTPTVPTWNTDGPYLTDPFGNQGVQVIENVTQDYDFMRQSTIPNLFGDAEFTLEVVIEPSQVTTTGSTASAPGIRENWSTETAEPGDSGTWWFRGNFLLDGHNNDTWNAGTFDLQIYNAGYVRWLFGDGDTGVPTGNLWGIQNSAGNNILVTEGGRHYITCVRRWQSSPASSADLELWVDGVLQDTVNTGSRTNMATSYWDSWTGYPVTGEQEGWLWGSETQAADGSLNDYEDYKGVIKSLAFFGGAKSVADLENNYDNAVDTAHTNYLDHWAFGEGSGTSATSEVDSTVIDLVNPGDFWP